jgi:hypothetical protein
VIRRGRPRNPDSVSRIALLRSGAGPVAWGGELDGLSGNASAIAAQHGYNLSSTGRSKHIHAATGTKRGNIASVWLAAPTASVLVLRSTGSCAVLLWAILGRFPGGCYSAARASGASMKRYRAAGCRSGSRGWPKIFCRNGPGAYSVLNTPRDCSSGTSRSTTASRLSGTTIRVKLQPSTSASSIQVWIVGDSVRGTDNEGSASADLAETHKVAHGPVPFRAAGGNRFDQRSHGIALDMLDRFVQAITREVDAGPTGQQRQSPFIVHPSLVFGVPIRRSRTSTRARATDE